MLNILVVEDETIERETLVQIIKQNIHECHHVFAARNGVEALRIYQEQELQLVCADINLPGMNGLDMIHKMQESGKDTTYLILSSYNYFSYAQEAIRLGVKDFLLKPYNIEQFIETLHNIIADIIVDETNIKSKIRQLKPMVERECLYAIVSDEAELELRRRVHLLHRDICSGFCMILRDLEQDTSYVQTIKKNFIHPPYLCIYEHIHGSLIIFILCTQPLHKEDAYTFTTLPEIKNLPHARVGFGPMVNDIAQFHTSFLLAREHIGTPMTCYDQLCAFLDKDEKEIIDVPFYVDAFLSCFEQMDETALRKMIHTYSSLLVAKNNEDILYNVDQLFQQLQERMRQKYPSLSNTNLQILPLQITTNIYQDLPLYMNLNIRKLYHLIEEERFRNTNHLVKEALKYIDHHYAKPITLRDVADNLSVSPFHISRLLSTTLHKTFTELLAQKRVEVSKELLKQDEQIKEIARRVGFQGQSYYNKIFKKYTGMTPKVYRNKMKN